MQKRGRRLMMDSNYQQSPPPVVLSQVVVMIAISDVVTPPPSTLSLSLALSAKFDSVITYNICLIISIISHVIYCKV